MLMLSQLEDNFAGVDKLCGQYQCKLALLLLHVHLKAEEHEGLQVAQSTPVLLVIPVYPVFPAHTIAITLYAYEYTAWHGMTCALYDAP